MAGNKSLHHAKDAKNDEFYTQLSDIELEMKHYREHFKGKTVFCNCDDPYESNFFKYFAMNFNFLGLKKLIATCYVSSPVMYTQLSLFEGMEYSFEGKTDKKKQPYKVEITEVEDFTGNGAIDLDDIQTLMKSKKNTCSILKGDGDFRSEECIELLRESDIVVTNPPFSMFREFLSLLVKHKKSFIILGNLNAVTYKEVFPLLKENKMWLGNRSLNKDMYFYVPKERQEWLLANKKEGSAYKIINGVVMGRLASACWYTNLDLSKRHEKIILYKTYSPDEYPHYDNYDAINIDKVDQITIDYDGVMGVPITFMDKYNPEQFEIIELSRYLETRGMSKAFVEQYYKEGNKGSIHEGHPDLCYYDKNGKTVVPYMRILIRRKEQPQ